MSAQHTGSITQPTTVVNYVPGTFLELGAAVPFTTPKLNGARVRPGARGGLEFIVQNPSGSRGVYIMPWEGVLTLCVPTVHDRGLASLLLGCRAVTPGVIRDAARAIALEGLAGRAASSAAEVAIEAEAQSRMVANFHLLMALVAQVHTKAGAASERLPPAELERLARHTMVRIAPALGRSPDQVSAMLEEIAKVFAPVGVRPNDPGSRTGKALAAIAALRDEMIEWARQHPDESGDDAAQVAESVDVTLTCAHAVIADVQSLPGNMQALLGAWAADPDKLAEFIVRPEWLLDGWERIVLLWQSADRLGRGITLAEMASLIPVLPKEAAIWARIQVPFANNAPRRRLVAMLEDWRTGISLYDVIALNEHLRAVAP